MPTSPDLYNASEQAAGRLTTAMLDAASAAGGVSEVQRRYGLVPDGKAGPQTQKVLAALAAGKVPIPTGRSGVEYTYGKFNYAEAQGGRIQISPAWVRENIVGVKLHTGKSFSLPFDGLLLFSSNLVPEDIMDPAFLRRLPYKIHVVAPTPEELAEIFRRYRKVVVCEINDQGLYGYGQLAMLLRAAYADPRIVSVCKTDGLTFKVREIVAGVQSHLSA